MTTELKIDGMTCGHCVAGVTKALRGVPGVERADVSLSDGAATVTHDAATRADALVVAVREEGYQAEPVPGGEARSSDSTAAGACPCCASATPKE